MLFKSIALTAGLLATAISASPLEQRCFPGEVVIYAKGTDPAATGTSKPYVDSTDQNLVNIAKAGVPGATVTALSYPASGIANQADYGPSWGIGIDNLQGLIKFIVNHSCKSTKIILLGYSQGASVITGAVGGGQGRPPLQGKFLKAIAAGVAIADPSFVLGLHPLDNLANNTQSNGGIPAQGNPQQFINKNMGHTWRSLCSAGDQFCANAGQSGSQIHQDAETIWHDTAVNFLQGLNKV